MFRYENQYKLHLVVHEEGKFVCSQCGKQLITKRYLVQHEKTAHGYSEIHCQVSNAIGIGLIRFGLRFFACGL